MSRSCSFIFSHDIEDRNHDWEKIKTLIKHLIEDKNIDTIMFGESFLEKCIYDIVNCFFSSVKKVKLRTTLSEILMKLDYYRIGAFDEYLFVDDNVESRVNNSTFLVFINTTPSPDRWLDMQYNQCLFSGKHCEYISVPPL